MIKIKQSQQNLIYLVLSLPLAWYFMCSSPSINNWEMKPYKKKANQERHLTKQTSICEPIFVGSVTSGSANTIPSGVTSKSFSGMVTFVPTAL